MSLVFERSAMWMIVLAIPLGCERPNPAYDDTEGSTGAEATSAGSSTAPPPTTGETNPADGTQGETDPGPTSTGSGATESAEGDSSSTGPMTDARIVVFAGPPVSGDAVGKADMSVFDYAASRCRMRHDLQHAQLECPSGIWGLLGSTENSLLDYPTLPGGDALGDALVLAPDEATVIANSYGELVSGELVSPLVGPVVEDANDVAFWWGRGSDGGPASDCEGWTVAAREVTGAIIAVDGSAEFIYESRPCNQAFPILCVCF